MAIKNIIFDVGNVLVDFRYKGYMEDLGFTKEQVDLIEEKVVLDPIWEQLDLGVMKLSEVYKIMKEKIPGHEDCIDKLFDDKNLVNLVRSYDYTADLLNELKDKGYKLYILSNYPDEWFDLHSKTQFSFIPYVDGMIVSGKVKMIKPDSSIYELLLNTYELKASECMFFDDRVKNVEAALRLGIDAHVFTDVESCREAISNSKRD